MATSAGTMSRVATPPPETHEAPPAISVVIPVRNGATTLQHQLQALTAACSARDDVEVVVADNGSTDGTATVAANFLDRLNLRIVDAGARQGSNFARNAGVRVAQADRILVCDADDEVDPQWVSCMRRAFDDGHELVAGAIDYKLLNTPQVCAWRGANSAGVTTVLGFLPAGHGANLGFSRRLYDTIGGFDDEFTYGDDVEFCWRAQLAHFKMHEVPEAVVHYRMRPSLASLFRQSRNYGAAEPHLYATFRHAGLRRRPVTALLREVWWLVTRLPFALPVARRGAWLRHMGQQIGRCQGAFRYRVLWW